MAEAAATASSSVAATRVATVGMPYAARICLDSTSVSTVRPEVAGRRDDGRYGLLAPAEASTACGRLGVS